MKKIVLTGGGHSGKTSLKDLLQKHFSKDKIFFVPEAATTLIGTNMPPSGSVDDNFKFQLAILKNQLTMEQNVFDYAAQFKNSIVVLDRGTIDGEAYCEENNWRDILNSFGQKEISLKNRYDLIIHLESVAVGNPKEYSSESNKARWETAEQAAGRDAKIKNAWLGSKRVRIVPYRQSFEEKVNEVISIIEKYLANNQELEKRYLVDKFDFSKMGFDEFKTNTITQSYLKNSISELDSRISERIRHVTTVTQMAGDCFFHTVKVKESGTRLEMEKEISFDQYRSFSNIKKNIIKHRHYFYFDNRQFELDSFFDPKGKNLYILEVEHDDLNEKINLPPFISIKEEITNNPKYNNENL